MERTIDVTYTNGIIAAREKYLLKDKLFRFCEVSAEEAFRALLDSGFGGGAETASSVYDYEKLIAAEESALDAFIREYAPSKAEKAYLLSSRDFHNAKALIKAAYLQESPDKLLTEEGLIEIKLLSDCVSTGDFSPIKALNAYLGTACEQATAYLTEQSSGAKVGEIFETALYSYLYETGKRKKVLKNLLIAKSDMTNILTAFRAGDETIAKDKYLPTGSLSMETLSKVFSEDSAVTKKAFAGTPYQSFVGLCLDAMEKHKPLTEAEKVRDGYDVSYFTARKYELSKSEPFLYYVFRRKMESANVRVIFVCLLAGLGEHDIKKRLRAFV